MIELKLLEEESLCYKPERLMKYRLVWCSAGQVIVVIDEKEVEINRCQLVTITSGQIHFLKEIIDAKGFILEFTLDFFCKNDNDIELIFHNGLFCHFDLNEVITVPDPEPIQTQLIQIQKELNSKPYQYLLSVRSRIELILVEINRIKVSKGDEIYKPDALFLKFLELVRASFQHNYTLREFAEMLGTTELKLNEASRIHTGKTAQNVIYGLIISESKRLLIYQNLTVKELAYSLGFNDPFYFSNFFKKHTGLSPKLYKEKFIV